MKKGNIIKVLDANEDDNTVAHYDIKFLRETMKKIYELYSNPKTTKKDFANLLYEQRKQHNDSMCNILDTLDFERGESFLKVVDRKDKDNKVTITFERINEKEKSILIKSIAEKLVKQMTPEQVMTMLQEQLRKLNDTEKLKKIDNKLNTEKPKIEGKRGCYKLVVDNEDVILVG
jgi:hypothetical protein